MNAKRVFLAVSVLVLAGRFPAGAIQQTMGLFVDAPGSHRGYTLFAPLRHETTYLIDNDGLLVNAWDSQFDPANAAYFLDNGHLLRPGDTDTSSVFSAGGRGGRIQEFDWDGTLLWEYEFSSPTYLQHHDIEPMPSGNILVIAWEYKTGAEAIAAGRDPALITSNELWPDHVVEIEPVGTNDANVVWEWHAWDHLVQDFDSTKANWGVVADHPELIDINFTPTISADWLHLNGIDYNPDLDQIILCNQRFSEFWIIDHSTTTAEAAGHTGGNSGMGGDILYRWGNPQAHDAGTADDRKLFTIHDTEWIPSGLPGAGNVMVFNNGRNRPDTLNYSSIEEVVTTADGKGNYPQPPSGVPHDPADAFWTYTADPVESFYSRLVGGAQRLPNGNTLICSGATGLFFEVMTFNENRVWEYICPVGDNGVLTQGDSIAAFINGAFDNYCFRACRYDSTFSGFAGRDLTPGLPIENYPTSIGHRAGGSAASPILAQNEPNPFRPRTAIRFRLSEPAIVNLAVYSAAGRKVADLIEGARMAAGSHVADFDGRGLGSGVYFYRLDAGGRTLTRTMHLLR